MSCSHTLKHWCGQGCHLYRRTDICGLCGADTPHDGGCIQDEMPQVRRIEDKFMDFPVKPLADRVIVKVVDDSGELKTKSGLVLPKSMSAKFKTAKVMAVGRGVVMNGTLVPLEVNVGDLVQITANMGDEMAVDSEKYLLITERLIVAVLGHEGPDDKCCGARKVVKSALLTETDLK